MTLLILFVLKTPPGGQTSCQKGMKIIDVCACTKMDNYWAQTSKQELSFLLQLHCGFVSRRTLIRVSASLVRVFCLLFFEASFLFYRDHLDLIHETKLWTLHLFLWMFQVMKLQNHNPPPLLVFWVGFWSFLDDFSATVTWQHKKSHCWWATGAPAPLWPSSSSSSSSGFA